MIIFLLSLFIIYQYKTEKISLMKSLKNVLIISLISLAACSDDSTENKAKGDHIWKEQTEALQKTKDLAKTLDEEFKKKMEQMEESQQE